jgi:phosphoenolpyruvate carboxylase
VEDLVLKVQLFGLHFAVLDIRQDSSIHDQAITEILDEDSESSNEVYHSLDERQKIEYLDKLTIDSANLRENSDAHKVIETIRTLGEVQDLITENGCHRYIISNSQRSSQIYELFTLIDGTLGKNHKVDVTPLFETVPDLKNARGVMQMLYENGRYKSHLERRGNKQYVMLGFSDGTKDGGYLMANWAIYQAKQELSEISREYGIEVVFFDGRGGPPARGGGLTHKFYASLGSKIEAKEIQLTIQGQTISSKFGNLASCQYNLEQLLSSSAENTLFLSKQNELDQSHVETIQELSDLSYQAYTDFKNHPKFLPYLENVSTLKYYAQTNIGSRPSKRGSANTLRFKDLRAIPFVGSWSLLKQNVPGFYGVGFALQLMDKAGKWDDVVACYRSSKFLQALLDNSEMSMAKSYFPLTAYMQEDPEYGEFWKLIHEEFLKANKYILRLSGRESLMAHEPVMEASIRQRENIVLPLLTIQQFALMKLKDQNIANRDRYEKLVMRSLFGNINASRNSA